jgi:uncharacterized protein
MRLRSSRPVRTLLALTALLALAATAAQADAPVTAGPPTDYTAVEGLSEVRFGAGEIRRDVVKLPVRDGVSLHVEVTRPNVDGERFPVILEASPYHGTSADREGTRIFPDPKDESGKMVGLTGYFAPRGYAVVMMDLRGTGRSQGCLDHMGQNDAADLRETIEWAARQPWSNGRVGMTGHSYVGSTPMIAAAQNPAGLVTIVPSAGIARAYDHQFQAGVAYAGQYLGLPVAYNQLAINRHLPGGDNAGTDMQYFGCGLSTISLQDGHRQVTGEMGPFHTQRDHTAGATAARIPVFLIQGTYDRAVRPPAMDWFNKRKHPGDKLWYGQFDHGSGAHPNRRGEQWVKALHAWFDKHLMQRHVDTGPPVEVFVNGERTRTTAITAHEQVFTARSWPGNPDMLELFPDASGLALRDARPEGQRTTSFRGSRASGQRVEFASAPAEGDTLLVGLPELELVASFTSQNLDLIAVVYDQAPDGSRRELSQFAINPALRHALTTPAPVVPGTAYRLVPPGWPMAHVLPEGHQLVLRVTTTDADKQGLNTEDAQISVVTGERGSVLRVPVVDGVLYRDPLAG